jgi:hypothetical protein
MGMGAGVPWLPLDFSDAWRWTLPLELSPKSIFSGE